MNKNPFTELYDGIRKIVKEVIEKEASFFIAKVINPLPNLSVSFNGIELDNDNLMISKSLLINDSAEITCSDGTITHNLKDNLNIGDMVVLHKINDSTFIVLDKVVSL